MSHKDLSIDRPASHPHAHTSTPTPRTHTHIYTPTHSHTRRALRRSQSRKDGPLLSLALLPWGGRGGEESSARRVSVRVLVLKSPTTVLSWVRPVTCRGKVLCAGVLCKLPPAGIRVCTTRLWSPGSSLRRQCVCGHVCMHQMCMYHVCVHHVCVHGLQPCPAAACRLPSSCGALCTDRAHNHGKLPSTELKLRLLLLPQTCLQSLASARKSLGRGLC